MTYSALSVARFVISYCNTKGYPISNLKLQKIMYYVWIDYYNETQQPLYNDSICAWQLGPVVPEVYYEFCSFAGTPIAKEYESELTKEDEVIVGGIVDQYIRVSASTLVSRTHQHGGAWDAIYCNGAGRRDIIPFTLIKKLECGN